MKPTRSRQSGGSLLILMLVMLGVFATVVVSSLRGRNSEDQRREQSTAAIEQARQALLAWSLSRDGAAGSCGAATHPCSPVELPCPDRNAIGSVAEGTHSTPCNGNNANTRIGRLPWKTLGIPKLVDGYGEPLWYSVDRQFVVHTLNLDVRRINSDSLATQQIYAANGATNLSLNGETAAAVIFAVGPALIGQTRSNQVVSNYLEAVNGRNNATLGGPFIAGDFSATFNDQLGVITGRELIAGNQARLGFTVRKLLKDYFQGLSSYPYPASLTVDATCRTGNITSPLACPSQPILCNGILPRAALSWGLPGVVVRPPWFLQNVWHRAVFYSVKQLGLCSTSFVIDGVIEPTIDAIFILPGAPRVSRANNLVNAANASPNLALYLDDVPNQNKWLLPMDRNYVTPACASHNVMYTCKLGVCSVRKLAC